MNDNSLNDVNMNIPSGLLDEIQQNIEDIISNFDIPDDNKLDVIKKINFIYTQSKHLSITDALTGLYNRRHFEQNFEREFLRAKRYGSKLSVAIIDIDFFKKINDTYGHLCGDYVLREIAYYISDTFRKTDFVFRYGGEEFVILLTETSVESAIIPLERLKNKIENMEFKNKDKIFHVTLSIGINANIQDVATAQEFFETADEALYYAKENGRNQIKIAE